MKKLLILGVAALAFLASEQRASAWTKFGFSIGANIGYEAADNNLLFGLFRNGPHPASQAAGHGGYGHGGYGQPGYGPQNGHGYGQNYWHGQNAPAAPGAPGLAAPATPGLAAPDFNVPGAPVPGIAAPQIVPMPYATGAAIRPVAEPMIRNASLWVPAN